MTRKERTTNDDIMTELGPTMEIIDRIQEKRLSYFGHVVRMKNSKLPKIALYGRVNGTRPSGRPGKRWMDNMREDCGRPNLYINQLIYPLETERSGEEFCSGCPSVQQHRHGIKSSQLK